MMKEHNYTFELTEKLRENQDECFLCAIEKRLEEQVLSYYLGPALMEPDCRMETNEKGFCGKHLSKLFKGGNQLGLALTLGTHLEEIREKLAQSYTKEEKNRQKGRKLFGKAKEEKTDGEMLAFSFNRTCAVCDKLNLYHQQVLDNFLFIYNKEEEFRELFLASRGLCLLHMEALLKLAKETMKAKKYASFVSDCYQIESKALEDLQQEMLRFTQKFDYRNNYVPWGTEKEAPERTAKRLCGNDVV